MVEERSSKESRRMRRYKPYPGNPLEDTLAVARAIKSDNAGLPMNRLDLAESLGKKPTSSGFRQLIISSSKYGLTDGSYNAKQIVLTPRGLSAVAPTDDREVADALLAAMLEPPPFKAFFNRYDQNKSPQDQIALNVLERECGIDPGFSQECLDIAKCNSTFAGVLRTINGSQFVRLHSSGSLVSDQVDTGEHKLIGEEEQLGESGLESSSIGWEIYWGDSSDKGSVPLQNGKMFVGHGKSKTPVEQLEKVLSRFKIPYVRAE